MPNRKTNFTDNELYDAAPSSHAGIVLPDVEGEVAEAAARVLSGEGEKPIDSYIVNDELTERLTSILGVTDDDDLPAETTDDLPAEDWQRRLDDDQPAETTDDLPAEEWQRRLNTIGEVSKPDSPEMTEFVTSIETSTPRQHPKRSKPAFLATPPESFDYECSLGFVRMDLLGQNDDVIVYKAQLYDKDNMVNHSFVNIVYIFKRLCDRLIGYIAAIGLTRHEQIISTNELFTDKYVRKLTCDWSIEGLRQFGFNPYEDTV